MTEDEEKRSMVNPCLDGATHCERVRCVDQLLALVVWHPERDSPGLDLTVSTNNKPVIDSNSSQEKRWGLE